MAKALLTDGLLSTLPAADACPADLCMVGKLLTVPALCLPVSAEEISAAPVQKQGVVVQNVFHRDAHLIVGSIGLEPMKTKANRFTVYPVCHFGNYPFCGSRRIQTSEAFQLASLAKRWYRSLTHTSNMRPTRCLGETTAFPLYFGRYSFCVAYQRIELWFPP